VKNAAVFVDRDGVIIRNRESYVKSLAEAEELPGAIASLARLSHAGHPVLIITNQSAIGRGLVSSKVVRNINERIVRQVEAAGGWIEAVMVCPHLPEAGCECRKPKAGLLIEASRRYRLELSTAYMVGDQITDVEAGLAAGCQPILLQSAFAHASDAIGRNVRYCADLTDATEFILNEDRRVAA
jgi:D-glycero-D-manno-heptose 1,7-bisphosphate phosphatase